MNEGNNTIDNMGIRALSKRRITNKRKAYLTQQGTYQSFAKRHCPSGNSCWEPNNGREEGRAINEKRTTNEEPRLNDSQRTSVSSHVGQEYIMEYEKAKINVSWEGTSASQELVIVVVETGDND